MLATWSLVLGAMMAIQAPATQAPVRAPQSVSHVLIIAGVGGAPEYEQEFFDEGIRMADAARTKYGVPDSAIVFLAEHPSRDPHRIAGPSTKAEVQRAFARIAARAKAGDVVFVLLIGHGSARDTHSLFNLSGPDMSAADFAKMVKPLSAQHVAIVNTASASAEFIPVLSGKNRVIITATKSVLERNETRFAKHFVAAYAGDGADADKDGRVSLLEAFTYAKREVAREYDASNQLQSEHAMLDDDGDGKGTDAPDARTADGALAARFFLTAGPATTTIAAASDPKVAALLRHKDSLEVKIDALRRRKATMDSTAYERELETLLLDLATTNQTIKQISGGKP